MTTSTLKRQKRCPNGTRKNKDTGRCVKIKEKRCSIGTRKNKDTGKCQVKQNKTKKISTTIKSIEKTAKVCPPNKPLYNPKTNRCLLDNEANRKKIGKIQIKETIKDTSKDIIKDTSKDIIKKQEQVKKVCPPSKPLYNPKTNRCVLDNEANRKKLGKVQSVDQNKKKQEQVKKVCPPSKPLYNPKTNRCLMNTLENMKKLGLEYKEKPEDIKEIKKYKDFNTNINLDLYKVNLLENFNKVTDNIWEGNMYKILISMHYVLSRHNNACFLSGKIDTPRKSVTFEKFNIMYVSLSKVNLGYRYKNRYLDDLDLITIQDSNLSKNKGKNMVEYMSVYKNFDLKKQIENCKKNNKRFAIGLIYLHNKEKRKAHQNSYIYDIEKQELEIFEPNGGNNSEEINKLFNIDNFYIEFLKYFEKNKIPIKTFYKPIHYCPYGPQSNDFLSRKLIKNAPGGYCAAWSIYYLDARLSNPNVPRNLLINTMNNRFRDESAVFINSYSSFILTNFLNYVLNFDKLKKTYPTFLKNFNRNRLTRPEKKYLSEQLIKETDTLVSSM